MDNKLEYVQENFKDHVEFFRNINGDKILIYDFEITDLPFIEYLNSVYPLVLVVTNSFDKYQYVINNLEIHDYFVLHEVTDTSIISDKSFDTIILFNTLSNIRNSVINNMPLKKIQTLKNRTRNMEMTFSDVLRTFLNDLKNKLAYNGSIIIEEFNHIDSSRYYDKVSISLSNEQLYLLDRFLSLKINANKDLEFYEINDTTTNVVGSYKDIYEFLTLRYRDEDGLHSIGDLIASNGSITDISSDSFILSGVLSADSWSYLLSNCFRFKKVDVYYTKTVDIQVFSKLCDFKNLYTIRNDIGYDKALLICK